MAKSRKSIPQKTKSLLQQEINSICPICDDSTVDHFEIHHIDENPENNSQENLLMLCPICHSKITKGDISPEEVNLIKNYLSIKSKGKSSSKSSNTINIKGKVSNSTVANSISAQTIVYKSKSKPKMEFADGAIGKKAELKNYIKHLIDRYNEYKEGDVGKSRMKYAAIWGIIKKEFKAHAYQIPETQFEELCSFLQYRIDNTKQGRINKGKGYKNYSSFEEIYKK
jgi:hypothetical protein